METGNVTASQYIQSKERITMKIGEIQIYKGWEIERLPAGYSGETVVYSAYCPRGPHRLDDSGNGLEWLKKEIDTFFLR